MFGIATDETIPAAYLTDHAAWDHYIGQLWHKLLNFLDFAAEGTVVEIAPGASVKIGSALKHCGFRGDFYVIDAAPKVIEALKPRYEALLPKARIHWVCSSLDDSYGSLPPHADFILASHVIDDMLVYAAAPDAATSWASSYAHAPSEELKQAWAAIESGQKILSAAKSNVSESLQTCMKRLSARHAIFSQYPSSALYDNGMASLNTHSCDVLELLRAGCGAGAVDSAAVQNILSANRHYNNAHIGEHVLNAKYWLLCRQK